MNIKVSDVLYINELTGKIELCNKSDYRGMKTISFCDTDFKTEKILDGLIVDGQYSIKSPRMKVGTVITHPLLPDVKYEQYSCEIKIINDSKDKLTIECREIFSGKDIYVMKIDFAIGVYENTSIKHKAYIRIYDVNSPSFVIKLTTFRMFGNFALSGGLYLLSYLDGDWERLRRTQNNEKYYSEDIQKIIKENDILKNECKRLNDTITNLRKILEQNNIEHSQKVNGLKNKIKELKETHRQKNEIKKYDIVNNVDVDYVKILIEYTKDKNVRVLSMNKNWCKKVLEVFSNFKSIEKSVDYECDILIVNTECIGHSDVEKSISISKSIVVYSARSNITRLAVDICRQLNVSIQ